MPFLPRLAEKQKTRLSTTKFLGYNHNPLLQDGEMFDQENMSGNAYPLLAPRNPRGLVHVYDKPQGMLAKEQLAIVDGGDLYYGGVKVEGIHLTDGPKQMVSMGAYLCIWPDKVYVNTIDMADCGAMGAAWTSTGQVTATMCQADGTNYDDTQITKSATAPTSPTNGQLWMDTSGEKHALKKYTDATKEWVAVATVYVKLQSSGMGAAFKQWDGVDVNGLACDDETVNKQLEALNTTSVVYAAGQDYIVIVGLIDRAVTLTGTVTVERRIPDMDYVTESENRLWGCRYGLQNGKTVNEIYACKLGDFRNWNAFQGISTDSYAVSVGTDGPFTGAATLKNYPCFFKEGAIHRIGGSMPSNYQMMTTMGRGVQKGSWASIARVGEALMYKGRTDVMVYDGSQPFSVSEALGGVLYYDAVAGSYGERYVVSMRDRDGIWHLLEYDSKYQRWYKQDHLHAAAFGQIGDELYCLDADTGELLALNGTDGALTETVHWSATFGNVGFETTDHKYLSRYNIRMQLPVGTKVVMEVQYDSNGVWLKQGEIKGNGLDTFMVPVLPRRCDHCQLRLSGRGPVKIYGLTRELEIGGDGK